MEPLTLLSIVTLSAGLIGICFTIYNKFKDPQIKGEKIDALFDQRMKFIQESNDRRFSDIHEEIKLVTATNQNHLHTVEIKMETLAANVVTLSGEVIKLGTIIEERIPHATKF